MNIFDMLILNLVLISFPMLFYMVYVVTNRSINKKERDSFFNLALTTSYFLVVNYGTFVNETMIAFFLGTILFLACLTNHSVISIILAFVTIILYGSAEGVILFLGISYILIIGTVIMRKKSKINSFNFVNYFLVFYVGMFLVWSLIYSYDTIFECSFLALIFIITIHILYLFDIKGKEALRLHIQFKELQKEEQIRLSLFKITHEIKNPIAVCKAYLDMFDINKLDHAKKYIPIIKSEIERLLLLLQDFLLVNKSNMKCDIMDVNMLIEEVSDNMEDLMIENNINFSMHFSEEELFINGDYNRLGQVLINILKNSVEASPSQISLKTDVVNSQISIIIADDGTGIPEDIMKKIFEPFYTTKQAGTGLGVSLSNEIVTAHNGHLEYNSIYGKGTSVKITLPLYIL
jgi:Signal transduction histidine kinase